MTSPLHHFMKSIHTWQYWTRLLLVIVFSLLITFAALLVWLSYQRTMGYMHPRRHLASGDLLRAGGIPFQEIELVIEDQFKLSAWYTPPQNGIVILVAHGHADKRAENMHALFASHGYGVVAWDFRAHGASEGEFTSLGYYEVRDAKAALDFARSQPEVEHIGAWGGSMGAVTMIRAAAQYPEIEALVADSPFTTLEEELNLQIPFVWMRPLVRFFGEQASAVDLDWVRPVDDIARISPRPVFIIQGLADGMVPLDSAERLYAAAGEPRQLWTEKDVPHLNMYAFYPTRYTEQVIRFFEEYLLK